MSQCRHRAIKFDVLEETVKAPPTESIAAAVPTCAASRHRQIVLCRIISNASHASGSPLEADDGMWLHTAPDKALENLPKNSVEKVR